MGHSHRETWRDDDEPLEVYHMDPYGISLFYGHSQWEHGQNDDEALELFFFSKDSFGCSLPGFWIHIS